MEINFKHARLQFIFLVLAFGLLFLTTTHSDIIAQNILSGRVYAGDTGTEPPTSTAIPNVTLTLYGSNDLNDLGSPINSTTTDNNGWYGLRAPDGYEVYTIIETDLSGYYSDGATSVDGTVINNNQIRYSVASAPLSQQTLTGNKFWDKRYETPSCDAAFRADPLQGCTPLTVNFTDQSTNPQSWFWKFPGGTPSTS
ncbi:hypothetical protein JW960_03880, partial [candidate division KSB1 bacterium]|nr:hypothetical protein [candidate division KSB1 bacterium]